MDAISRFIHMKKVKGSHTVEDLVSERDRHLQEEHQISQQIQAVKNSMKYWNCRSNDPCDYEAKEKTLKELQKRRAKLNSRLAMLGHQLLEADEECRLDNDEDVCSIGHEDKSSSLYRFAIATS